MPPANTTGGEWVPVNRTRAYTALTYDARDAYVLAFGGKGPGGALGDTWKYDNGAWTWIPTATSPSPRWGEAMSYDDASASVVLFGGRNATTFFNDTWVFSGGVWTNVPLSVAPSARAFGVMTFDAFPTDYYLVLFGGANATTPAFGGTWEFNAGAWTKLTTTGTNPPALEGVSMAYDYRVGYVVLFGGVNGSAYSSATYEYRGGVWATGPSGPTARAFAGMAYDRGSLKVLVLFGGCSGAGCSTYLRDTWELVNKSWVELSSSTPGLVARAGVAVSFDGVLADFYTILFGGYSGSGYLADTWNLTATGWTEVTPGTHPAALSDAVLVDVAVDREVVLFGGLGSGGATNATWIFSGGAWTRLCAGCGPSPRYGAAATYNPLVGGMVLFGGYGGGSKYFNDTWTFVGNNWTNVTSGASPPARYQAALSYAYAPLNTTVLFGGRNATTFFGDTWEFNGTSWSLNKPAAAPSARADPMVTYDGPDGYVLLFGGYNATSVFNGTWTFSASNPNGWSQLNPSNHPSARFGARADYNPYNGYVVMFGGSNFTGPSNQTWGFIHGVWTRFAPALSPAGRSESSLTYDRADDYIVQFGGSGAGGTLSDTWLWVAFNAQASAAPNPTDVGVAVSFGVAAVAGVLPYSYVWAFADGGTSTLTTPTHSYAVAGSYNATVTVTDSATPRADVTVANVTIVVNPLPAVNATAYPSVAVPGYLVAFNATVTGGTHPLSYTWSFGDGSANATTADATHAYATTGTYNATVTVNDSVGVSVNRSVTVRVVPGLGAVVSATPTTTDVNLSVAFTATPIGGLGPYSYEWAFGDGQFNGTQNTTHAYSRAGNFTVEVWVNDSAGHSFTDNLSVSVNARPTVSVAASPSPTDVGAPVSFRGNVTGGTPAFSYLWTFGDGGSAFTANASHTYSSPGNLTVTLRVTDHYGVVATGSASVTVLPGPTVEALTTPTVGEVGVPLLFVANESGGVAPFAYAWVFGDGSNGSGSNTTHAYATTGTFVATVWANDSLGASAHGSVNVTVNPPLASTAVASPTPVDVGVLVHFSGTTTGGVSPVSYAWSFGDASTGSGSSATHAYGSPGTYTAVLWANDSLGVSAVARTNVTVVADPSVTSFTVTPGVIKTGESVAFSATLSGGTAPFYVVYSGLPAGCASVNATQLTCTPTAAGTYLVHVSITDTFGKATNSSVPLVVNSSSGPTFLGLPQTEGYVVLAVVVIVIAALIAYAVSRSRRRPPAKPAAESPPPPTNDPVETKAPESPSAPAKDEGA